MAQQDVALATLAPQSEYVGSVARYFLQPAGSSNKERNRSFAFNSSDVPLILKGLFNQMKVLLVLQQTFNRFFSVDKQITQTALSRD